MSYMCWLDIFIDESSFNFFLSWMLYTVRAWKNHRWVIVDFFFGPESYGLEDILFELGIDVWCWLDIIIDESLLIFFVLKSIQSGLEEILFGLGIDVCYVIYSMLMMLGSWLNISVWWLLSLLVNLVYWLNISVCQLCWWSWSYS